MTFFTDIPLSTASVERLDEGKIVKVSFVIYTKKNLTKEVRYREKANTFWETRTTNPDVQQPLVIEDLDPDKHYEFRVLWFVEDEQQITDGGEGAKLERDSKVFYSVHNTVLHTVCPPCF